MSVPADSRPLEPLSAWSAQFTGMVALVAYLLVLTGAEVAVSTVNPVLVFPLHGGLIALTAAYFILRGERSESQASARELTAVASILALAPLIRIISLTLPLAHLEPVFRYAAAGVPMMIGGVLVARAAGFNARQIGLVFRGARWQLWAVALSIALGFAEFIVLRPEPLGSLPWTAQGVLPALSIALFTGFPEELIFRGVMQTALRPILGRWNWVYVSGIFAVLHVGYGSYLDLVFVFGVGLFYGWIFERTRSIIGVSVGHGVANVILFFVAPNLIDPAAVPSIDPLADPVLAVALALAVTATTVVALRMGRGEGWRSLGGDQVAGGVGPIRLTVLADPTATTIDPAGEIIPADRIEVTVTSRVTKPATLIEHRTPLAQGIARLTSRNTFEPILVAAGTTLLSTDGHRFRTAKRAFLRRAPNGGRAIADVPVEAETAGAAGDVQAGAIRRVPVGLAARGVTVTNDDALTGGTQPVIRRVSAADYRSAQITAARRSWEEIGRRLAQDSAGLPESRHIVPATTIVATTSVKPEAATTIGHPGESLELTMQRVATATAVDLARLRAAAIDRLAASVQDGFRLVPGSIRGRVIEAVPTGAAVSYTVEISGRQRPATEALEAEDYRAA